ncbi:alcohol dehydrogenase catalytic domain-containing protein [Halorubrum sp. LN27]|uniref:zinc-dependent alcohol dehydrogenase n=1 Tax=Halorubrum sp. LN27 TaxID=2801032 RepID=UPI00190DB178|nr:alcohol dehydrogenase catalytic domain-containing protein [Halorubrum sp. LN27]
MDAVVIDEFESFDVIDVPRPEPGPGEVLIDVSRVQLSVTECLLYRGESVAHYDAVRRRIRDEEPGARLFGHEFCGVVAECGPGVEGYEVGDRVYAPGKIHCGECPYCRSGYENYCPDTEAIGYDRPGALAESVRLPTEPLRPVPEGVSDAEGAALQPLASSVLCVADAEIDPGDDVLVVGAGVMGFQCALLAERFGAATVYAADVRDRPLEIAAANGAVPIDATETDPVDAVREATGGLGTDVVIEAVGGDQTHATEGDDPLAQAFRAARRGGTVLQVGHISGDVEMTPRSARSKAVRWENPRKGVADLGPGTDTGTLAGELVASGAVPIGEYVTHEFDGLDSFGTVVDVTLDKGAHDALGPAQIVLD